MKPCIILQVAGGRLVKLVAQGLEGGASQVDQSWDRCGVTHGGNRASDERFNSTHLLSPDMLETALRCHAFVERVAEQVIEPRTVRRLAAFATIRQSQGEHVPVA